MTAPDPAAVRARLAQLDELSGFNEWGAVDAFPHVHDALAAVLALVDEAEASNGLRSNLAQATWRRLANFSADDIRRAVAAHLNPGEAT